MRKRFQLWCVVAAIAAMSACTGGGSSSSNNNSGGSSTPNSPTPSSTTPTTVTILSSNGLANLGANSFSPNPVPASQGSMLMFHNSDSVTHHIVLDDGSLDVGNLNPGQSSATLMLTTSGGQYHCIIHPSMVGSINVPTDSGPMPSPGGY